MKNDFPKGSDTFLDTLRTGAPDAFEQLYVNHREDFFSWAGRRFEAGRQDMEDAWQDAVVALYQQVCEERLTHLSCSIRTWLFATGFRRLLNNHRKLKRIYWRDTIDDALIKGLAEDVAENAENSERSKRLLDAMNILSPQCREMLVERYYHEQSIESIKTTWQFNNANTTSASLSRCLKKLKQLLRESLGTTSIR